MQFHFEVTISETAGTFRLPAELPSVLLRVAMERKLRGERPCTQQDIVAQAVREWLERNAPRN